MIMSLGLMTFEGCFPSPREEDELGPVAGVIV